jgi:hypothetical protein
MYERFRNINVAHEREEQTDYGSMDKFDSSPAPYRYRILNRCRNHSRSALAFSRRRVDTAIYYNSRHTHPHKHSPKQTPILNRGFRLSDHRRNTE